MRVDSRGSGSSAAERPEARRSRRASPEAQAPLLRPARSLAPGSRAQAHQVQQAGDGDHEVEGDDQRVLSCAAPHTGVRRPSLGARWLGIHAPLAIMDRCCSRCLLDSERTRCAVLISCSDGTLGSAADALRCRGDASAGAPQAGASGCGAPLERKRRGRATPLISVQEERGVLHADDEAGRCRGHRARRPSARRGAPSVRLA